MLELALLHIGAAALDDELAEEEIAGEDLLGFHEIRVEKLGLRWTFAARQGSFSILRKCPASEWIPMRLK